MRRKQTKSVSALIITAAMVLSLFCGITTYANDENFFDFGGGNGTESNPYKVSTHFHLNNVRNFLGAYFIQINDIDVTAATASGGAYYNGGSGWLPIGDSSNRFSGAYDGGGYKITGLKINRSSSDALYVGLFGYIDGAGKIQNLGMVGSDISAEVTYANYSASCYAGGIAGYLDYGTISNCYNIGSVSSSQRNSSQSPESCAGGIVGCNSGTITNCYNAGVINSSSNNCYITQTYAGGISGYNGYRLRNCYNIGSVSSSSTNATSLSVNNISRSGGITGENQATISNCYNVGNISSRGSSGHVYAGSIIGLAGYLETSYSFYWNMNSTQTINGVNRSDANKMGIGGVSSDSDIWTTPMTTAQIKDVALINLLNTNRGTDEEWCSDALNVNNGYPIFEYQPHIFASVGAGSYSTIQNVTFSSSTSSYDIAAYDIYYTLDGTDPTAASTLYTEPVEIYKNTTLKAFAMKNGNRGSVITYIYTISPTVSADIAAGSYSAIQNVTLTSSIPLYDIYYTLDGTEPTMGGTLYTEPIEIYKTTTLKVFAAYEGTIGKIFTYTYTLPTINIVPDKAPGTYPTTFDVVLSSTPDWYDKIYYTLDGTEPTTESTIYDQPIIINNTATIKAMATYSNNLSPIFTFEYIVSDEFAGGDGSESNPFKICTPDHLNNVRHYLDKHFIQMNDIDMTNETATGGTFYNDGTGWEPISNDSERFTGAYDGGGYKIIGLKINRISGYAGLFGYINKGIVQNLGLVNNDIESSNSATVGAIVGYNDGGTISDCFNTGIIVTDGETGGIVGQSSGGIIKNCYNTGDITSETGYGVGGIVGRNINGTISNCYNTGNIIGRVSVGGIVGYYDNSDITNCYNVGNTNRIWSAGYSGSIAGSGFGSISNCYWNIASEQIINGANLSNENKRGMGYVNSAAPDTTLSKTTTEMKDISFVDLLNANRGTDAEWLFDNSVINSGYPVFEYQSPLLLEIGAVIPDADTVAVKIINPKYNTVLVAVVYDSHNKLISIRAGTITSEKIADGKMTLENIVIPADSGTVIKAMIWNGMNTMQPLCDPKTVTRGGDKWINN